MNPHQPVSPKGELRKIRVTVGLILLWALAIIAVVLAEGIRFAAPAVRCGNVTSVENSPVQKLQAAAAQRKLGSAAPKDTNSGAPHGVTVLQWLIEDVTRGRSRAI